MEAIALEAVLGRVKKPKIYRKKPSLPIILSDYWKDYGFWALKAVSGDKKIAKKLHSNGNADAGEIGDLLREARQLSEAELIIKQLPRYDSGSLPIQARIADQATKTYKGKGTEAAIKYLDEQNPENSQARSTIYAFLLCMETTSGREWKFSDEQRDVGIFLKPFVKELMDAEPVKYHEAMETLLRYTGSTKEISPV